MFKRAVKEEVVVPATIDHLGEMRDFITRVGRKFGVSERIINAFKLAIDEAGTNIIRHAYRDWEGSITIRMLIKETSITVSLIDQGHSFDPRNVRDPDLQRYVDIGKKGGLGIFIIRRVIDEIDYRKTTEGNELRLTKHRVSPEKRTPILPDMSLSMKTRFSLIASGIFTLLVALIFFWIYMGIDNRILEDRFKLAEDVSSGASNFSLEYLGAGNDPDQLDFYVYAKNVRTEYSPLIKDLHIVSVSDSTVYSTTQDLMLFTQYSLPEYDEKLDGNIYLYSLADQNAQVYHLVTPVTERYEGEEVLRGTIHLLLDKRIIDREIAVTQRRSLGAFGLALLIGYIGVFLLIYLTMSPFKKLATWVRDLGHDADTDEMDFDSSDEIGEIARAFNEITDKFRKSQENLAEQERMQKEMQVAQEIQHTLLPSSFPNIEGYELASYYEAAKEVGGDYFDFVEVDKDTIGIVVADVSGKGVPGSLVMTMIRTALRTEARGNKNAADVLARVNDFVINDMKRGMFVTVFYIILDSHSRTINYASAGHNPMILYRSNTKKSYYLNPRGFPIGINLPDNTLFRKSIESDSLRLQEGDVLISYTDGITEAMNPQRDRFGEERFLEIIRKHGKKKVDPLVDEIREDIKDFTEGYAQSDDITLVAIKEKMKAEDVLFNMRNRLLDLVNDKGMTVKEACKLVGVSTSTYYKYKKRFEKMGEDGLRESVIRSEIEEKHISIEEKAKLYDIIKNNPEYGAKRISEELNTEKYGFTELDERRIYDELLRSHLNNKKLRQAFVERGGRGRRLKPPGTPFLSLDGNIVVGEKMRREPIPFTEQKNKDDERSSFRLRVSQSGDSDSDRAVEESGDSGELLDSFLGIRVEREFSGDQEGGEISFNNEEETARLDKEEAFEESEEIRMDASAEEGNEMPFAGDTDSDGEPEERLIVVEGDDDFKDGAEPESGELSDNDILDELMGPDLAGETAPGNSQTSEEETDSDFFEADAIIDEMILATDSFTGSTDDDEEATVIDENISLDEILEIDERESMNLNTADIEEGITASVAGELLDELDELPVEERLGTEDEADEEGFLEMMEGIGFDRRDMLSTRTGSVAPELKAVEKKRVEAARRSFDSGLWYYKQGEYNHAIQEYEKAIAEDPKYSEAYQCLGDTYFRLGQLDEAKDAYEQVRQIDPDNTNVMENLGVIFANRGDYKKAVWQWGEVLKRNPGRKDIIERIKKMQRVIRQRYL